MKFVFVSPGKINVECYKDYSELAQALGIDSAASIILQYLKWNGFKKFIAVFPGQPSRSLPRVFLSDNDMIVTNYVVIDEGTDESPSSHIYKSDYLIIASRKRRTKHFFRRARELLSKAFASAGGLCG